MQRGGGSSENFRFFYRFSFFFDEKYSEKIQILKIEIMTSLPVIKSHNSKLEKDLAFARKKQQNYVIK